MGGEGREGSEGRGVRGVRLQRKFVLYITHHIMYASN